MPDKKEGNNLSYIWIWIFELAKGIFIFLAIVVLIHFFIATIFVVDGISMEPNFHSGQYILAEKLSYLIAQPNRGDVVVVRFPGDPEKKKYIKRIIGLPGEKVEIKDGKVFINDVELEELYIPLDVQTLPNSVTYLQDDEYFIMGDNRPNSNDSRAWGACQERFIIGKALAILLPFSDLSVVPSAEY